MERAIIAVLVLALLAGCAGLPDIKKGLTSFTKDSALMPDEFALSGDFSPDEAEHYGDWHLTEVTGGLKWRLK